MAASGQDSAKQNEAVKAAAASKVPFLHHESAVTSGWCCTRTDVDKFSFVWRIENFSFRKEALEGKSLESSVFSVGFTEKLEWKLRVLPKHYFPPTYYFSIYLILVSSYKSGVLTKFQFSILNAKGEKAKNTEEMSTIFTQYSENGFSQFLKYDDLLNKENEFLPDDNLTILCEGSFALDAVCVSSPSRQLQTQVAEHKISQDLGSLFEEQKFTDLALTVGGKDLLVHKAILAARSPVFKAMFEHEMKESKENRVVIEDFSYEAVREMIAYIYTGKLPNIEDMAEDILVLADKYGLDELKAMCEKILCSLITVENVANLLILAEMHSAKQLNVQVGHFVSIWAKDVMRTSAWKDMSSKYPLLILKAFETLALR